MCCIPVAVALLILSSLARGDDSTRQRVSRSRSNIVCLICNFDLQDATDGEHRNVDAQDRAWVSTFPPVPRMVNGTYHPAWLAFLDVSNKYYITHVCYFEFVQYSSNVISERLGRVSKATGHLVCHFHNRGGRGLLFFSFLFFANSLFLLYPYI